MIKTVNENILCFTLFSLPFLINGALSILQAQIDANCAHPYL